MAFVVLKRVRLGAFWEYNLPFLLFPRIGVCKEYVISRLCQGIGLPVEWFGREKLAHYWIGESRRPKQGMISHMRNCVTSEAVSDLIGKASIHPEKLSTIVNMNFIFHIGGMWVKSICQSSPGICPGTWCAGNEGIGFRGSLQRNWGTDNARVSDLL